MVTWLRVQEMQEPVCKRSLKLARALPEYWGTDWGKASRAACCWDPRSWSVPLPGA